MTPPFRQLWEADVELPGGLIQRWATRAPQESVARAQLTEKIPVGAQVVRLWRGRVVA